MICLATTAAKDATMGTGPLLVLQTYLVNKFISSNDSEQTQHLYFISKYKTFNQLFGL